MANCLPFPSFPPLPNILPLSISAPLPAFDINAALCCQLKLVSFNPAAALGPLIVAIPGVSSTIAIINQKLAILDTLQDAIALKCPRQ